MVAGLRKFRRLFGWTCNLGSGAGRHVNVLAVQAASGGLEQRRAALDALAEYCYKRSIRFDAPTPAAAAVYLAHFSDPDDKVGESVMHGLNLCCAQALDAMIDCLRRGGPLERERACEVIGKWESRAREAVPALRGLLSDAQPRVRMGAIRALAACGDASPATVAAMLAMAEGGDAGVRGSMVHALGVMARRMEDRAPLRAAEPLVRAALGDAAADVRRSAVYALEGLGLQAHALAELAVAHLVREENEEVRWYWGSLIKSIGDPAALLLCLPALEDAVRRNRREVRDACEALGKLGAQARGAVPVLIDALAVPGLLYPAAEALWRIDGRVDEAVAPIRADCAADFSIAMCHYVSLVGPPAAALLPEVLGIFEDEDWDTQWAACDALGALRPADAAAIAMLASRLAHDSPIVRGAAAGALARIGEPAVPALAAILLDEADGRHEWAADALARMGHAGAGAADALRTRLARPDSAARDWCRIALACVAGDPAMLPYLLELCASSEAFMRGKSLEGMAAIGLFTPEVKEAIAAARADSDERVGQAAAQAWESLTAARH